MFLVTDRRRTPSFHPKMLPGLEALYLPGIGVTGTVNASQWDDQYANGRHFKQASGAAQPIYLPFTGQQYMWSPAVSGNYASTPHASANDITGNIEFVMQLAADAWTGVGTRALMSKVNPNTAAGEAYSLGITNTGVLQLAISDGSVESAPVSTAAVPFSAGQTGWIKANWNVTGTAKFYTSTDGVIWTQLGTDVSATARTPQSKNLPLEVGSRTGGIATFNGKIFRAQLYNGIGGTLVADFNPARWTSGTTFTASTGEVWTINSTGSKPAQIVDGPWLLADGAAHFMQTDAFNIAPPYTLFALGRPITWTSDDRLFDGLVTDEFSAQQVTGSPQIRLKDGTSSTATVSPTLGQTRVLVAQQDAAGNASLQLNNGTPVTATMAATTMTGLTLWRKGNTASGFGNFQTAAFAVFSTNLNAGQVARMNRYLSQFRRRDLSL